MGKQQFHHFAIAISRSNPPRGPVRGPNFGPRGIGAAIQEQPGHSDVTECECHADDEVMRRVMADPKSADLGCGGVFTAVCTLHKRDLMIRLLQAGIRVPSPLTACRTYVMEDLEMFKILLEHGMSPDLPSWQGQTFLHNLCSGARRRVELEDSLTRAAILLDAGASLSPREDEYSSTPLAWAARTNMPEMVEFLLARGAPPNLPDDPQ